MTLTFLIIAGVLLAAFLLVLRRAVRIADIPASVRERVRKILPALTSGSWLAYAWLVVFALFGQNEVYPYLSGALVLVLTALLGWYILRDIVAGITFVTKHPTILNHRLTILGLEGKVIRLGPTNLHLQTDTGETVSVPYNRVAGEVLTDHSHTFLSEQFSVSLTVEPHDNPEALASAIREHVLLLPWTNARLSPTVKVSAGSGETIVDATFHCLSDQHAGLIEQQIRKQFGRSEKKPAAKPRKKKGSATGS